MRTIALILLTLPVAATSAPVPPLPPAMSQADAETLAGRWWGPYHRGSTTNGAAWILPQAYTHVVTPLSEWPWVVIKSDGPKEVFQVGVCGGRGDEWNATRSPEALYYVAALEFGSGNSWDGAFHDALKRVSRPVVGRSTGFDRDIVFDSAEESRFLATTRRSPVPR